MRKVQRWVAECDFQDETGNCSFNVRTDKTLHETFAAAERESVQHAFAYGHIGAKQVTVERTYVLQKERIVDA